MIVEALLLLTILIFIVVLFQRIPNDLPPGEWGLPIIGYTFSLGKRPPDIFKKLQAKYGKILIVKVGPRVCVLLSDFSTIKLALAKEEIVNRVEVFSLSLYTCFRNCGISMANGLTWSANRKFTIRVLTHFGMGKSKLEKTISVEVNTLINDLKTNANKPVKIAWNFNVAILNIIWGLVADKKFPQNDKDIHYFSKMIDKNFSRLCGPILLLDIFPWLVPIVPRFVLNLMNVNIMERSRDNLIMFMEKHIKEHIEKFDSNNIQDYIDMFLLDIEERKGDLNSMSEEDLFQLKMALIDLFVVGSETITTSIRWYILYMAKHPEIQEKIKKEICSNVSNYRFPSLEDKDNLPYFEASIYESLRFASLAVIGIPRVTTEDVRLEGYNIPKGAVILAYHENCHRNPAYWERPDDFYPEHFIDENGKFYIRQEGFLPFSHGRRKCLGESLARMELFLFLGAIMQNFTICEPEGQELSLDPDPDFKMTNVPYPYAVVFKTNC